MQIYVHVNLHANKFACSMHVNFTGTRILLLVILTYHHIKECIRLPRRSNIVGRHVWLTGTARDHGDIGVL